MEANIKFKNFLKQYRSYVGTCLQANNYRLTVMARQLNEGFETLKKAIGNDTDAFLSNDAVLDYCAFKRYIEKNDLSEELIKKLEEKYPEFKELETYHAEIVSKNQSYLYCIKEVGNIIRSYDDDKVKEEITDIALLLRLLRYALEFEFINFEELSTLFGMAINFDNKVLNKKQDDIKFCRKFFQFNEIKRLSEYYNVNGTFKFNEDLETFKAIIEYLVEEVLVDKSLGDSEEVFINTFVKLLDKENNNHLVKQEEAKSDATIVKISTKSSKRDYEVIKYVRLYYKNGEVVGIPDDIDEFRQKLRASGISDKEIRYVMKLVDAKIKEVEAERFRSHFSAEELVTYDAALKLLNNIPTYDMDYIALTNLISEIGTIIELMDEDNDPESLELLQEEKRNSILKIDAIRLRKLNDAVFELPIQRVRKNNNQTK